MNTALKKSDDSSEYYEEADGEECIEGPSASSVDIRVKENTCDAVVKSSATVQHNLVQNPTQFAQLQNDTNLNLPPPNWLHRNTISTDEWLHILQGHWAFPHPSNNSCFSSFNIAQDFPDSVGEVDIITDAENIKRLLKIPFSNATVSMIVHRIGKSILIDNFDICSNLLRNSQNEWIWLRDFYAEHLAQMFQSKFPDRADKSRHRLHNKNLFSKFLHYSVANLMEENFQTPKSEVESPKADTLKGRSDSTYPLSITALQELVFNIEYSTHEENLRRGSQSNHLRNVLWTFEDIQMLIGSDMPIFGCGTHPAVSLRLREATQPITVLTGIDYWLDNLMSNVPELVMCCHLDGKVQKYHMFKTEEIPNMENSCFSPKVVNDIAQNILSFLKTNTTKCGHTYWLLGGGGSDMVKLYDLTSLCNDIGDEPSRNPYTVPVANLLFRMAKVMCKEIHKNMSTSKKASTYALLKDCMSLLDKDKHSKYVSTVKYFLADLFMPNTSDSSSDGESSDDSSESEHNDFEKSDNKVEEEITIESGPYIEVSKLSRPNYMKRKSNIRLSVPQLLKSNEWRKRCKQSLQYIFEGLDASASTTQSEECSKDTMPKPNVPIVLPYETLNSSCISTLSNLNGKNTQNSQANAGSDVKDLTSDLPVSRCKFLVEYEKDIEKGKLHLVMFLKASQCYQFLADEALKEKSIGQALKHARLCLSCFEIAREIATICFELTDESYAKANGKIYFHLLILYSNIFLLLSQRFNDYDKFIKESNEKELGCETITEYIESLPKSSEFLFLHDLPASFSFVKILNSSLKCLELASGLECGFSHKVDIPKNKGNVYNLLGVYYMDEMIKLLPTRNDVMIKLMSEKSQHHFNKSIDEFEKTCDNQYLILIYGNFAKLRRSLAHYHTSDLERNPSSRQINYSEMQLFNKAVKHYDKSLDTLKKRNTENYSIWDNLSWDLSSTLFQYASLLQDNPPTEKYSVQWVEQETIRLLVQALSHCNFGGLDPPSSVQTYRQRQAVIHHRLGALYHCILRSLDSQNESKKSNRSSAEEHYSDAANLFFEINQPGDHIRVILEHLGLLESYYKDLTSFQRKFTILEKMIDMILQSSVCLCKGEEVRKANSNRNPVDHSRSCEQVGPKSSEISEKHVEYLVNQFMDCLTSMCRLIKNPRVSLTQTIVLHYKKLQRTAAKKFSKNLSAKQKLHVLLECFNAKDSEKNSQ